MTLGLSLPKTVPGYTCCPVTINRAPFTLEACWFRRGLVQARQREGEGECSQCAWHSTQLCDDHDNVNSFLMISVLI